MCLYGPCIGLVQPDDDLRDCPEGVKDQVGYALHIAQEGGKHESAKPMKGFGGASVLEIVADD